MKMEPSRAPNIGNEAANNNNITNKTNLKKKLTFNYGIIQIFNVYIPIQVMSEGSKGNVAVRLRDGMLGEDQARMLPMQK